MSSESASGVDGQRSAEATEANELVLLPRRPPGRACLRREVGPTLLEAATLAPRGRDTTHLAVLVGRVADPVDAEVPGRLHLVHAGVARLAVHDALRRHLLAAPAAHPRPEDHVPLLRLVPEHASLLRAARPRAAADRGQLTVLPRAETQEEP